ncbi:hypothetical protein FOB51_18775 [Paracoccus yeei]|uniref:Uncharacterized protein n=2 Tax=Paracoccus yeei TaxID=147645 RepID=A0A5P2QZD1_9RHOB|nr:hypothetical protein FOB51_18775 [Paracoccus yeei]
MNIDLNKIRFGDPDALHELVKQKKDGSRVLVNSFVAPPRADISQLESGAKFFIVGPKGSGKTTFILKLREAHGNHKSNLILFKSKIRREDRDQLDKLTDTIIVDDQGKFQVEADYKTVWEWYLLKNTLRLVDEDDILEGKAYFRDVVLLLEADKRKFNTLFDSMRVEGAKGSVKVKVGVGALSSEIGAEIDARRKEGDTLPLLDLVRLSQEAIKNIRLKAGVKCRLYVDELEFFLEDSGDGERDRRMVRDLIFSVYNTNLLFDDAGIDALCYACVRSEVINSFPGSSAELSKILRSFSVHLNWEPVNDEPSAVIEIFTRKIQNSEIEEIGEFSDDPWAVYFPKLVSGKDVRRFLLDMGSHRPRGVLLCLMAAAERAYGRDKFIEADFDDKDNVFAQSMFDEFKDELSASLYAYEIDAVFMLLRGKHYTFNLSEFRSRIAKLAATTESVRKLRASRDPEFIIKSLYRCGVIGNFFRAEGSNLPRQTWFVRGYPDPIMDKPFVVHQSLQRLLDMV